MVKTVSNNYLQKHVSYNDPGKNVDLVCVRKAKCKVFISNSV